MLASRGIAIEPLLVAVGIPRDATSGDVTAPLERIVTVVNDVAVTIGDPTFGVTLAEAVPTGAYGIVEFIVRTAPTLGRGLEVLCEFASLINPVGSFRYGTTHGGAELHYAIEGQRDTLGMHLNEYTLLYILRQFRLLLDQPRLPVTAVWFSHRRATHVDGVARAFGVTPRFGARNCGFSISRPTAAFSSRTADAPLFEFLVGQARAQLAYRGHTDVVAQTVRVIEVRLAHGSVTTDAVARAMSITPRTLQRHLADAGTTFRDVLAYVRRTQHARLLTARLSESDIAKRLGFSSPSVMRRALDYVDSD